MATEVLELQIRTTGVSTATSGFRSLSLGASDAARNIEVMTSSLRFMRQVLVALSFARVFEGVAEGITSTQESLNLLRTVTPNVQQASAAFDHFLEIANETRTPLNDIVKLAVQVSRTIADGPNKLRETDSIVRNIAESFSIAGANGQSVRNVIRDINEMFAGGTVIMRQFRAILQQDRPLIDAVAKSVVATGAGAAQFNKILNDARSRNALSGGTLTEALKSVPGALKGSDVQRALEQDTALTKQFQNTTVTLGQAFTQLNNQWEGFLKHLNDATNGLNFLSGAVQYVAQHIPLIVALGAAIAGLLIVDVVLKAFANLGGVIFSVFNIALTPVKLLYNAVLGLAEPLIFIGTKAIQGLIRLPGFLLDAGSAVLEFGQYLVSAAVSAGRFVAQLPITILNGITRAILFLGESAGVAFKGISEFAETATFTVTTAFKDLVSVFSDVVVSAGSVGRAFITLAAGGASAVGGVITTAVAALLETVLELIPAMGALAIAALPLIALGEGIYGALQPLGQVGTAVGKLGISFTTFGAVVLATMEVVVSNFSLFTQAISALWADMLNGMKNRTSNFGNETTHFLLDPLNLLGHSATSFFKTDRQQDSATPLFNDIVAKIKKQVPEAQAQINKIVGPFEKQIFDLINGTGDVTGKPPQSKGYDSALASLTTLIAKIEPYYAGVARIAEVQKVFNKAAKEGVDVSNVLAKAGLTRADVLTREIRAVVGAGNADTDYTGKIKLLTSALNAGTISLGEFARLSREAQEAQLKTKFDTNSGVLLAFLEEEDRALNRNAVAASAVSKAFENGIDPLRNYRTTVEALNEAVKKNPALMDGATKALVEARLAYLSTQHDLSSGEETAFLNHYKEIIDQAKIATDVFNSAFARDDALNKYLTQMKALDDAVNLYGLDQGRATEMTRDFQIELLNTQTDALSGFQRGLLQVQKTLADTATTAATVVTNAFNNLSDVLTNFFTTGKFNADQFFKGILSDLTRLAVQQSIEKPLADALGFGPNGSGGIFGAGGFLGSLFGDSKSGVGGLGGALSANGSFSNPFYVVPVGAGGGASGLLGSLFGGSSGDSFGTGVGTDGFQHGADPVLTSLNDTFTKGADAVSQGIGGAFANQGGGFIQQMISGLGGILGQLGSALGSLFSGGSGGGGLFSGIGSLFSGGGNGIFSDIGSFLGFDTGGSFRVGGTGGSDSQVVPLRLTPGEVVNVSHNSDNAKDDSGRGGSHIDQVTFVMPQGTDMNTFRRSQGQITARLAMSMARAHARNA